MFILSTKARRNNQTEGFFLSLKITLKRKPIKVKGQCVYHYNDGKILETENKISGDEVAGMVKDKERVGKSL